MAYTFLDNSLNTIGVLTNKGGQTNDYWGDSITHEIATSQDVLTSVSLSVDKPSVNIDTSGNQKTWNHVIQGLSFNIDGIGRKVNENDYLIYQEGTNGKYYLMAITQVDESAVQSGFHYKTVQGLNAAAYDLSRKTLRAKSFAQIPDNTQEKGTAQNILKYIFDGINWDVRTIGSFGAVDYDIAEGTTAQAVLLDIIGMFEAEVDAYVLLNNWGKGANVFNKNGSIKRIFDFSTSLGKYRGETIRYDKNMVSITKTGARDSMYTKLYVNGNNITIADVNHGSDFIVDDVANRKYNKLGAVSTPVTYLEGIITNSAIESPTALLAWGKKQLDILNHPRYNYQISAVNDDKVQLGDTVIIQDTHASDPIYLKSKVISKSVSLADPVNNSFIVGEFSPIVIGADNGLEDTDQIMQLVNQANQTAINAQNKANENAQKIEDTRTDLEKTIDQKLQEGKDYADDLNSKAIEEQTKFNNQINQELATAKAERDALSTKTDQMIVSANSYADTMYGNAVAVAKDEASKALSDANKSLEQAKSDLTDGIASEASERQQAVQTVNSQAQSYANQAKSDAIEAAKTADGVVRKDFKETTDALSSTISQNKEDADGKISTAQTTATQALDGLSTKVSQTDYDKKTGDLSTAVNTVTQTANETKDELASVTETVNSQSAKINTISNTVDGTTQTISDIQTEQGKQSGSIATLQSRADGFDASITKINDFVNSQGQVNQLTNTEFTPDLEGWSVSSTDGNHDPYRSYLDKNVKATTVGFYTINADTSKGSYFSQFYQSVPLGTSSNGYLSLSWQSYLVEMADSMYGHIWIKFHDADGNSVFNSTGANPMGNWVSKGQVAWERQKMEKIEIPQTATEVTISFEAREGIRAYLARPMLVFDDHIGDYIQGNYNNNGALAKVKLTADKATLDLSNYKKDADGRISKAQADITATSNEVKTKVSQSDYDAKTGDLTTKYGQVKATADAVTTDVASYKKSNDSKVSANTANIEANAKAIALKVSQTDFDSKSKDVDTKISNQQITVDKISQSVTELQAKANAQGQVNQFINTEFNPDMEGWDISSTGNIQAPYRSYWDKSNQAQTVAFNTVSGASSTYAHLAQNVQLATTPASDDSYRISMSWFAWVQQLANYNNVWVRFYDKSNTLLSSTSKTWSDSSTTKFNVRQKWENINVPKGANYVNVSFDAREGTIAYISRPMFVLGPTIGDYVAGPYNNNARVTALELDVNGIHGTVNDPKKGLSATWDLANQGQTLAVQAQKDAKTADGKAVAAQKDATTAVTTANGTQTTVTSVQKDVKDLQSTTVQTAGQVSTEIEDRKNGDKSVTTQLTGLIDQRVKDVEKGYESAISQSADNIMLSVSAQNRLINTQFTPDLEGWSVINNGANGKNYNFYRSYVVDGETTVGVNVPADAGNDTTKWYSYFEQDVAVPGNNGSTVFSLSWDVRTVTNTNYTSLWLQFKDANHNTIDNSLNVLKYWNGNADGKWYTKTAENIAVPKNAAYIRVSFQCREGTNAYLKRPMLTFTSTAMSYMPGLYNTLSTNSVLQLQSDFFSLNLHTNSQDIITSINGDHNGVTITGKHITLDGDVNVTGDFYAKGGNFKNLNAANITGDIATFIKSGFNDAFGSYTTLDAKGMQISTGGGVTQYSGQYAWFYNYNGSTLESIGRFGSSKSPWNPNNVDYMEIAVSTWRGAAQGGAKGNGGDGIMFAAYDPDMKETRLLTWETSLSAGYHGLSSGWNFWDNINFNGNKIIVPSADWHVSFSGMKLGQTGSTYPSIVEANEHKTGISFGLHEVYLLIDGKSYPMSPKIK